MLNPETGKRVLMVEMLQLKLGYVSELDPDLRMMPADVMTR